MSEIPKKKPIPWGVKFQEALGAWFDREQRDLPWRRTRDPYSIWVSEIMLQQTRVEAVIPKYNAFLQLFPDPSALAGAAEEQVLSSWSGLGYYSRARNLHRGAALVSESHSGRFPRSPEEARRIPGVGRYTAAAVLSIAYGLPYAVVDGNVARVLARLFTLKPGEDRRQSRLEELAGALLDHEDPGRHNQAMMELGATVCLPHSPHCGRCPVAAHCGARREGHPERYPTPRPKPATMNLRPDLLLVRDPGGRLLLERGRWPVLPRMWLPPVLGEGVGSIRERAAAVLPVRLQERIGWDGLESLGGFSHAITRHRIRFRLHRVELSGRAGGGKRLALPEDLSWFDDTGLRSIGRSSILDKALAREAKGGAGQAGRV